MRRRTERASDDAKGTGARGRPEETRRRGTEADVAVGARNREVRFDSWLTCICSTSARIDRRRRNVLKQCLANKGRKRGGGTLGGGRR